MSDRWNSCSPCYTQPKLVKYVGKCDTHLARAQQVVNAVLPVHQARTTTFTSTYSVSDNATQMIAVVDREWWVHKCLENHLKVPKCAQVSLVLCNANALLSKTGMTELLFSARTNTTSNVRPMEQL